MRRCLPLLVALLLIPVADASATKTVCAAGCDATTVQGGVDLAAVDEVVEVAAGTYEEQVQITTEGVVLRGAGVGSTTIRSPVNPAVQFTTSTLAPDNAAVVLIRNVADATVEDLTIDGAGRGGPTCTLQFIGLGFHRAGGVGQRLNITGFRHTPLDGCQVGSGVYMFNDDANPPDRELTLDEVDVSDFQKTGVLITSTDLDLLLTDVNVTGAGAQTDIAQNGIVVNGTIGSPPGERPTGLIGGGTVKDHLCGQASCGPNPLTQSQSSGIALIDNYVDVTGVTVENNDNGVRLRASSLAREGDNILFANAVLGNRYAGLYQSAGSSVSVLNTFNGPGDAAIRAGAFLQGSDQFLPVMDVIANDIAGATNGIHAFRNSASSATPDICGFNNRIVGNTVGSNNTAADPLCLVDNWWGCNTGPNTAGCDTTTGPAVTDPWLTLTASADPATIETGGKTSDIEATVERNSDGDVVPGPFFPDIPATFSATLGSITPALGTLADGLAEATLTSGDQTGTSTVTAGVDNATATADVQFVAPPKNDSPVTDPGPTDPGPKEDPPVSPPAPVPNATLVISHRRVPYSGGRIKLRLICVGDPGSRCRGNLQLTATSLIKRAASGRANFDIPAGDQATVRVQPPKRLVELVRKRRRAIGKVIARLDPIPGQTVSSRTVKRLITIQARRSKR